MRAILWLVLGLGVLWGGYWFAGAATMDNAATDWFAQAGAQGITARQDGIAVAGFPNRFDLTVTKPELSDPATGWGWSAPFAQVLAMSWKPWHVIAALPDSQQIIAPGQTIALQSSKMQASVRVVPASDLALAEVRLEGHDVQARSDLGWQIGMTSLVAAMVSTGPRQHLGLQATDLTPDHRLTALVPQLGPTISTLHLDATVTLTAPIDRHMAEAPPRPIALDLADFRLIWGELTVSATGKVTAGPDGLAMGKIDFRFQNWTSLPQLLVAMGLVQPAMAVSITSGLQALATSGGDPKVLDLALTFDDGRMSFGPLPLGPAPRLN